MFWACHTKNNWRKYLYNPHQIGRKKNFIHFFRFFFLIFLFSFSVSFSFSFLFLAFLLSFVSYTPAALRSNIFSVVYNQDGIFIFCRGSRSCFKGSRQSRSNFSIPLSLVNMVFPDTTSNIEFLFEKKTGIFKSLTSSAFINKSDTFEPCSLRYFQLVQNHCRNFQCNAMLSVKVFECLWECLDLNFISMFREFYTILPIFTQVFVYYLLAK